MDKEVNIIEFQKKVDEVLIRHSSILDIITKLDQYNSRINRAIVKAVTGCGCIEISGKKHDYNKESLEELKEDIESHLSGKLCPICKDILEEEIGEYFFYLAALSNTLGINLEDAIKNEYNNINSLGLYSMK